MNGQMLSTVIPISWMRVNIDSHRAEIHVNNNYNIDGTEYKVARIDFDGTLFAVYVFVNKQILQADLYPFTSVIRYMPKENWIAICKTNRGE